MKFIDRSTSASFLFKTGNSTELGRISSDGDLLIGKTSTGIGTVGAEVRGVGQLWATRDGGVPLALNRLSSDGTIAQFYKDGGSIGSIAAISGDLAIYSSASGHAGLRLGNGYVASTNNAGTIQNGSISLGLDSYRWEHLWLSGDANIGGNAVITGDLTVNGTTTTINTATLDVEDKNITVNAGGTHASSDGAGLTIEKGESDSVDATILWDESNTTFDFSHAIDVTGTITADNNLSIQNSSAYGSIEVGGVSGGFIDIKRPFSDDYDLRLIAEGDGGVINVASGELTIQRAGSAKLATTSTGIAVTGNATFNDSGKAIFGAGSDLQIYHDGSNSYIDDAGTGALQIRSNGLYLQKYTNENMIRALADGAVSLYYDNAIKLETTSTGIDVTGTVTADGLTVGATSAPTISIEDSDGGFTASSFSATNGGRDLTIKAPQEVVIQDADTGNKWLRIDEGDISFYEDTGTTAKFFWDASAERLGLGTSAPGSLLELEATGSTVFDGTSTDGQAADGTTLAIQNLSDTNNTFSQILFRNRNASKAVSRIASLTDSTGTEMAFVVENNGSPAEVLRLEKTGFAGLGTAAPAAKLDIVDTSADVQMRVYKNDGTKNTRVTLTADDSGAKIHYRDADNAGALRFNNNLGEVMRITANTTRVGIGTSSPSYSLHVYNATNDAPMSIDSGSANGAQLRFASSGTIKHYIGCGGGMGLGDHEDLGIRALDNIILSTGSGANERLRIDSSGLVGVGTSSPFRELEVTGTGNVYVRITAPTASDSTALELVNTGETWTIRNDDTNSDALEFGTSGGTHLTVDTSGNVGIGQAPTAFSNWKVLELKGGTAGAMLNFENSASTRVSTVAYDDGSDKLRIQNFLANPITFETNNTEQMRLDASGNLLVGTSNTTWASQEGLRYFNGSSLVVTRDSDEPLNLNRLTNDGVIAAFKKDGTTVGSVASKDGDIAIGTSDTGFRFIDGSDAISPHNISTNAGRDAAIDLGTSGARFKAIYLSGTVNAAQVNLADAGGNLRNVLDLDSSDNLKVGTGSSAGTRAITFFTENSEQMRLDASGNLLVGKSSADNTTQGVRFLGSSGFMSVVRSNNTLAIFNRIDGDGTLLEFRTNGTTRGSISISGSTTSYNTTSDERAKQNIEDADDAGAIVDAIQVRKFDWIDGGEHQRYGMVAQELSTVAPEAVSVPDDAEEMQSVDYSKLVPMLVKEIQSLRARVAQLEGEN